MIPATRYIKVSDLVRSLNDYSEGRKSIGECIDDTPVQDVKPVVHGRWLEMDDGWDGVYYDCSACGESWTTIEGDCWDNGMNYCPHCGAKMDKPEES